MAEVKMIRFSLFSVVDPERSSTGGEEDNDDSWRR